MVHAEQILNFINDALWIHCPSRHPQNKSLVQTMTSLICFKYSAPNHLSSHNRERVECKPKKSTLERIIKQTSQHGKLIVTKTEYESKLVNDFAIQEFINIFAAPLNVVVF